MPRMRQVIRLFLASPRDVEAERMATERVVGEINRTLGPQIGIMIELNRWEEVAPDLGRPEQVILDQTDLENSDIFIGIMWNRFGTPTGRADSGTEEEFQLAYSCWERTRRPRVMFYFCQRAANLSTEKEITQKGLVIKFRRHLDSLGLFREFETTENFESQLRQDLIKHLLETQKIKQSGRTEPVLGESPNYRISRMEYPSETTIENDITYKHKLFLEKNVTNMVKVPAGKFLFGLIPQQDEIPYDYFIDLTPVTNSEYLQFLESTGYNSLFSTHMTEERYRLHLQNAKSLPEHPVTAITWHDAVAYAASFGKRLPTEREWEKAARGTDGRIFPWGNKFDSKRCNSRESGLDGTTPVKKYENGRSPFGCYDMAGNVFEWTNDWSQRPRFSSLPNSEKVNKGASYNRPAGNLVCWFSESDPPSLRMVDVGFRCVYVADEL